MESVVSSDGIGIWESMRNPRQRKTYPCMNRVRKDGAPSVFALDLNKEFAAPAVFGERLTFRVIISDFEVECTFTGE